MRLVVSYRTYIFPITDSYNSLVRVSNFAQRNEFELSNRVGFIESETAPHASATQRIYPKLSVSLAAFDP